MNVYTLEGDVLIGKPADEREYLDILIENDVEPEEVYLAGSYQEDVTQTELSYASYYYGRPIFLEN